MRQIDVLCTVGRKSDGVLADVFSCASMISGEVDEVSLSSEDKVLALSDSYPRGWGGLVGRTAGTTWRLEEAFEDVMEVLELTAGFLRRGVGRGRAPEWKERCERVSWKAADTAEAMPSPGGSRRIRCGTSLPWGKV
jgi:hypothetical protein